MKAILSTIGAAGVAMLLTAPVYAQNTAKPDTAKPAATQVAVTNSQSSKGPTGSLEKSHGEWRASKLIGANVYNDTGDTIGSIDDLLVNNGGKIDNAVVSVGGFLGIGSKLVEVPFNEFQFQQSQTHLAAAPAAATELARAPLQPRNPVESQHAAAATPIRYSIVLPRATKDSLSKAPSFSYQG